MARVSLPDRVLEHWASWRLTFATYEGTGPSTIVRFREPPGTRLPGCQPLYQGRCHKRLAALDADLAITLGLRDFHIALVLYGLPGDDASKVRRYGLRQKTFSDLRHRARVVALRHMSQTLTGQIMGELQNDTGH